MNPKLSSLALICTSLLIPSIAQSQSAKSSVQVGNVNILNASSLSYQDIMRTTIRTSRQKDLVMDVSLECGLLTRTKVSSKQGISDTSSAQAGVKLRVLIDGREAKPGEVTFCRRSQELTATFGGIMSECSDQNGDGILTAAECTWTPEELELILDTMNANSFNFILDNVGTGTHLVQVQARIDSGSSAQLGSADAKASIGKGSIDVEEVRLIKDQVIDF